MSDSIVTNRPDVAGELESVILRNYYKESDFFASPEGIFKLLSVVTGLGAAALLVWGGACLRASWVVSSGTAVALSGAALSATLYAGLLTAVPVLAPNVYFYADLVLSTALGITLLVFAVLNMTFCDMPGVLDYIHGPLALVNAALVAGSAVITYITVMGRLDAGGDASTPQPQTPPTELDV